MCHNDNIIFYVCVFIFVWLCDLSGTVTDCDYCLSFNKPRVLLSNKTRKWMNPLIIWPLHSTTLKTYFSLRTDWKSSEMPRVGPKNLWKCPSSVSFTKSVRPLRVLCWTWRRMLGNRSADPPNSLRCFPRSRPGEWGLVVLYIYDSSICRTQLAAIQASQAALASGHELASTSSSNLTR